MEKRIDITKERALIYRFDDYPTIKEVFFKNGDIEKIYILMRTDDYNFNALIYEDDNINELSFEYDINHPLYLPLLHLLNNKEKLLIDDDDTREEYQKYLVICKSTNKINLSFINNNSNSIGIEKFTVFIKNIMDDLRSKINQNNLDTKERLTMFFREVNEIFKEDENNKVYYR